MTLQVPYDLLQEHKSLQFDMIYHVNSGVFEKINIVHGETFAVLGQATFTTKVAPAVVDHDQDYRGASPKPKTGAASQAIKQNVGTAANRNNKSTVATTAARKTGTTGFGRGPATGAGQRLTRGPVGSTAATTGARKTSAKRTTTASGAKPKGKGKGTASFASAMQNIKNLQEETKQASNDL